MTKRTQINTEVTALEIFNRLYPRTETVFIKECEVRFAPYKIFAIGLVDYFSEEALKRLY